MSWEENWLSIFEKQNRRINKLKCAYSSEIKVYGEIGFSIEIGPNSKVVNFLVVDNIVSEIILGIRSLKTLEIDVIARDDAVKCYGVVIPFVNPILVDKQVFVASNKKTSRWLSNHFSKKGIKPH